MRECPQCHGRRVPCDLCKGRRIVEGEPTTGSEAARVSIAEAVERDGLHAVYERLKKENP
jgi:hypothetical protein